MMDCYPLINNNNTKGMKKTGCKKKEAIFCVALTPF